MISLPKPIHNHQISKTISHDNISVFITFIPSTFIFDIITTKTVEILIARHIIAGAKIIGIRLLIFKYFNIVSSLITLSSNLKAFSNIRNGNNAIANQSTHTLIINTTATAINGIQIASI
jgi:hypothetical protein